MSDRVSHLPRIVCLVLTRLVATPHCIYPSLLIHNSQAILKFWSVLIKHSMEEGIVLKIFGYSCILDNKCFTVVPGFPPQIQFCISQSEFSDRSTKTFSIDNVLVVRIRRVSAV